MSFVVCALMAYAIFYIINKLLIGSKIINRKYLVFNEF